jgi:hypothetical protein
MVVLYVLRDFKTMLACLVFVLVGVSEMSYATSPPNGFVFQGRILKPDATAEESASVVFTLQLLSTTNSCVLYSETQTVNMTGSNGIFSMTLGAGSRAAGDPGLTLTQAISNVATALTGLTCATGSTYTPASGDTRSLHVSFYDGTSTVVMSPDQSIQSVPYALYAEQLQGKQATDFIQVDSTTTQAVMDNITSTINYPILQALLAGTSTLYAHSSNLPISGSSLDMSSGGRGVLVADTPASGTSAVNKDYVDSHLGGVSLSVSGASLTVTGQSLRWNQGSSQWEVYTPSNNAGTVTSIATGTGLTGGPISSSGTISVNVGTGASQIVQLDSSSRLPAVDGSLLTNLTAANITGTIIGTDSTKLPLAGGNMTGTINMGGHDILNTGYITMSSGRYLGLGVYTDTTEATLVSGTLTIGGSSYAGSTWYNSTSNAVKYWNGSSVVAVGSGGGGTQTLTIGNIFVGNGSNVATGVALSGDATLNSSGTITVTKLQGTSVSATVPTSGQILQYNGSSWYPTSLTVGLGYTPVNKAGDTMSGTLTVPSNGFTIGTNQFVAASGNIGIGTTNPGATLDVNGSVLLEGTNALSTQIANGAGGTTLNKLAILSSGDAVVAGTSNTIGVLGVVVGNAGTTGSANIAQTGQASCIFDGATTAGDYVTASTTTGGDCHDSGATYPTAGQVMGRVLSTHGSGGTYGMFLFSSEIEASSGGGSAQWATSSSNIYYSTGEVGVGAAPDANFSVTSAAGSVVYADINQANTTFNMQQVVPAHAVLEFAGQHQSQGGAMIYGQGNGSSYVGLTLVGLGNSNTPSVPATVIQGGKWNGGSGTQALGAGETLLQVQNLDATPLMTVFGGGNVGIGTTIPTAALQLKAGTATAGTAPLKLTSGVLLTTPENGAVEFDGTSLYITAGGVRTALGSGGSSSFTTDVTLSGSGTGLSVSNNAAVTGTITSGAVVSNSYSQSTGNFAMSGTGTFATGTGPVALNGSTTIAANQNFSMTSGTGKFSQTYSGTGPAAAITDTSGASGDILDLITTTTAAVTGDKAFSVAVSGANAGSTVTRYGVYSGVTATGTSSTNVAGYFSASGATNNYGIVVPNGNVGIGTTTPTSALEVHNGAIVADAVSLTIQSVNFTTGNIQVSSYNTTSTVNVCGLVDGGAYTLILTGYSSGTTVTLNGFSDTGCSSSINVDFGGSTSTYTNTVLTSNNTTVITFIYSSARGVAYASYTSNFYH